jgi:hypothetical protein
MAVSKEGVNARSRVIYSQIQIKVFGDQIGKPLQRLFQSVEAKPIAITQLAKPTDCLQGIANRLLIVNRLLT